MQIRIFLLMVLALVLAAVIAAVRHDSTTLVTPALTDTSASSTTPAAY